MRRSLVVLAIAAVGCRSAPTADLLLIGGQVARPMIQRTALSIALGVGMVLLVANGRAWPERVAAARAAGADVPPPGCLRR